MKRLTGVLILILAILTACKNNDEFTVSGKFENFSDIKQVAIYKADKMVDSAVLNSKGEFKFTVISPEADFFYISVAQKTYPLVAKNGDEIDFNADYSNPIGEYEISGSEDSEKLLEFNKISARYNKIYSSIQQEYQDKVGKNPAIKDSLEAVLLPRFEKNIDAFGKESLDFAKKNQNNLAGFYAMNSLDQTKYEADLIKYSSEIKGKFPNTKAVQDFVVRMDRLKALAVGQIAPDFEMASTDGSKLKLSQFRGQYVLLDFWASWCGPCRQENPNVVKQYNAFKDKGFTVFGVSLDADKEAWVKAIKDDKLTWNHVSELKQWDSQIVKQYSIEGIPSSFLLDKNGKILAKNLRATELEQYLTKLLK